MIYFEKFTENDFERFKSWIKDEEYLIQFAGPVFSYPLTDDQLYRYLNDSFVNAYKVIDKKSNLTIGHCEINTREEPILKLCRILIAKEEFRGKGIGQQIIRELLNISFNQYKSKMVELNVFEWNTSAIKCYEKVGFKINHSKRNQMIVNNKIWISLNMIIEKKDFLEKT